ncbi:hypothetical protein AMECASPLE_034343 [Ameca splendens]|uniref:Secreted protein n=1 Tax=Ameca splendens TaxID=208324 RepID=A0ABV0XK45_9TELE
MCFQSGRRFVTESTSLSVLLTAKRLCWWAWCADCFSTPVVWIITLDSLHSTSDRNPGPHLPAVSANSDLIFQPARSPPLPGLLLLTLQTAGPPRVILHT